VNGETLLARVWEGLGMLVHNVWPIPPPLPDAGKQRFSVHDAHLFPQRSCEKAQAAPLHSQMDSARPLVLFIITACLYKTMLISCIFQNIVDVHIKKK
jgi:hypothetical protein